MRFDADIRVFDETHSIYPLNPSCDLMQTLEYLMKPIEFIHSIHRVI